jgi:hypothetical protein
MLFNPARMDVQETDVTGTDWTDIYGDIKVEVTIESSTFGAEFVALPVCLRYKLRSFGIGIDGPTDVWIRGQVGICRGRTVEQETFSKICCHRARECCAMGTCRIAHVNGDDNLAHIFTKVLSIVRHTSLLQCVLRHFRHHSYVENPLAKVRPGFGDCFNIGVWGDVRLLARLYNHIRMGFTGIHE